MQKLEDIYQDAALKLGDNGSVEFSPADFTPPPSELTTDGLVLHRFSRISQGFKSEQVYLLAEKAVFRRLALLLIAGLFHTNKSKVMPRLELTHPAGELPSLFIDNKRISSIRIGNFSGNVTLDRFNWSYREPQRNPWFPGDMPVDVEDLPRFNFTDQPDGNWLGFLPTTGVVVQGRPAGHAALIELFLNLSDHRNPAVEFQLEGEGGFRGVASSSIEVGFALPGSIHWEAWAQA